MPMITGTPGADTLQGLSDSDTIVAGAGDDVILRADTGANSILAGDGNDRIEWTGSSEFPRIFVDGGEGTDTLDLSSFVSASYFFSRSVVLRNGPQPNTIEGWVDGYERVLPPQAPTLPKIFLDATGIERILGGFPMSISLDGFTTALEVHGQGAGVIATGSGDDVIALHGWRNAFTGLTTKAGFTVDAGSGLDALRLDGPVGDYLIVPSAASFTVYDGSTGVYAIKNVEQIRFGGNPAMTIGDAARLDFDAEGYLARYADLKAAFGTDLVKAYQHFQAYGLAEGRTPSFDGLAYIASYRDLIEAFGPDAAAGTRHYAQSGAGEGRSILFDPADYAASYSDLASLFGTDAVKASSHYIVFGAHEGRAAGGFDPVAYLLSNPDLGGMTPVQVRGHWLTFGADEGRTGDAMFGRDQVNHVGFSANIPFGGTQTIAATFETTGDRDWFGVSLLTQLTYTIDGSPNVSKLAIYDSLGRLVASDTDGQDFTFELPSTGVLPPISYYLVVTGAAEGAYTVSGTLLGSTVEAAALMNASRMMVSEAADPASYDIDFDERFDTSLLPSFWLSA